jgi:hypothetical protein
MLLSLGRQRILLTLEPEPEPIERALLGRHALGGHDEHVRGVGIDNQLDVCPALATTSMAPTR